MSEAEIQDIITGLIPETSRKEDCELFTLVIPADKWHELAKNLKTNPLLQFDYLYCLTAIDWPEAFVVAFHLESTTLGHRIVIQAEITDKTNPTIDSVTDLWRTADLQEREAYDLMGIVFNNHPDLRRLFLTDDWVGFPLRKDYVDEINMIGF